MSYSESLGLDISPHNNCSDGLLDFLCTLKNTDTVLKLGYDHFLPRLLRLSVYS
jgi:hypothetical protein